MASAAWRFEYHVTANLPPLAWIARLSDEVIEVRCGTSVRCQPDGFFEGTWAGEPGLPALSEATTVFGSDIVRHGADVTVVTPSHQLEGVYHGSRYDRPIPRRLAEEAGLPRGSFAVAKRAATVLLQLDGRDGFSEASWSSIRAFAAADGRRVEFRRRHRLRRSQRALLAVGDQLRLGRLVRPLARRRDGLVHFERDFGALVLRWAVAQVRARYEWQENDRVSGG